MKLKYFISILKTFDQEKEVIFYGSYCSSAPLEEDTNIYYDKEENCIVIQTGIDSG